jgi:hypothetical protein
LKRLEKGVKKMNRPSNGEITKARLKFQLAERQHEEAKRHEARAHMEKNDRWIEYMETMEEAGWCGMCDKERGKCSCPPPILLAAMREIHFKD